MPRLSRENLLEKIGGRKLIASVSGGKDSTAMCLYLKELGLGYQAVFMDTGWEFLVTYDYLMNVLPDYIGPVTMVRYDVDFTKRWGEEFGAELEAEAERLEAMMGHGPSPMIRLCIYKGIFPGRRVRWCTEYLKINPMKKFIRGVDDEPISVVGIRSQESLARSKMPEWEWNDSLDCEVWRPLIDLTESEVIALHKKHGVPPNPLYLRGSARVGCWPCIYARKLEIRLISELDPVRIQVLAELEKVVTRVSRHRDETMAEQYPNGLAWFQNPKSATDPVTGKRAGDMWSIDRVVEWSKTKRGGKDFEPFAPLPYEGGCFRWGMCDTSWRQDQPEELPDVFDMFEEVTPEEQEWRDQMESYMGGTGGECPD